MFYYVDTCDQNRTQKKMAKDEAMEDSSAPRRCEGISAVISLVMLILTWSLTSQKHYNVFGNDQALMLNCVESKADPAVDMTFSRSDLHNKAKIREWFTNCANSPYKDIIDDRAIEQLIQTNYYVPIRPGLLIGYDVLSFMTHTDAMGSQDIATYVANLEAGKNSTALPRADLLPFATQMYQTAVSEQCSNKHEVFMQTEEWGEYTFSGLTVGTRRYEVRLWTLLQIVFVVSGLFQAWRYVYWQHAYRPVGPDFTRWLEYMLTSPLQIFIIGMSVMVRDVSMLATLAFLQGALVMLGYLLELAIQGYVDFMRTKYFAEVLKAHKGLAGRNTFTTNDPKLKLSKEGSVGAPFPSKGQDDAKWLLNLMGIFLNQEQDPNADEDELNAGAMRAKNTRMWIIYRISVVFLFSWSILGLIFTLLFTRLARQGEIIHDCPQSGGASNPEGIPAIVWGILGTQCVLFASFGVNASVLWVSLLLGAYNTSNCCNKVETDLAKLPLIKSEKGETIENIMDNVYKYDLSVYKIWIRHTLVYSILNLVCKSLLEILLFVYAGFELHRDHTQQLIMALFCVR